MRKNSVPVNPEMMRKMNCSLILSNLRRTSSQTRAKLAKQVGLTRSTVSSLIDELIDKNFVREIGYESSSGGRRGILIELNPKGGAAIAVKISALSIHCALSNLVGEVLWHKLVPLTSTEPEGVLSIGEQLIYEAISCLHDDAPLLGIGVATTGLVSKEGEVIYSQGMNWEHLQFRKRWEEQFNLPVTVNNDVSLAALGENRYGIGGQHSNFIYLEIGYGLGAGIVIGGQLYRGTNGYAGEVGHMVACYSANGGQSETVIWETLVNVPSLLQTVQRYIEAGEKSQLQKDALRFDKVIEAAHNHDPAATKALIELSLNLGIGIASLVNIFDITTFIVGGELGVEYEPYLDIVLEEIRRNVIRAWPDAVQVQISTLVPDAALIGAVARVFDDILEGPLLKVNSFASNL